MPRHSKHSVEVENAKFAREQLRQKGALRVKTVSEVFSTIRSAVPWICVAVIVWQTRFAIQALSGKETLASFGLMTSLFANKWIAYGVAALTTAGFFNERKARKKLILRQAPYVTKLEKSVDPHRSSSHLGPDGDPEKER